MPPLPTSENDKVSNPVLKAAILSTYYDVGMSWLGIKPLTRRELCHFKIPASTKASEYRRLRPWEPKATPRRHNSTTKYIK